MEDNPMRIQILSDLHLNFAHQKPITIVDSVDLVVIAGDVSEGALESFEWVRRLVPHHVAVVMVMGNHEHYRRVFAVELEIARSNAPKFDIRLLENASVVVGGIRFLGATLFTNDRIFGDQNTASAMRAAADGMNDHKRITWSKSPWRRFRPQEALMLHASSARFFADTLAVPFSGPSIAVSHMAQGDDRARLAPKFDGTLGSLADCYESDEDSAYQELKENTAEGYKAWLKMVRETVGQRKIARLVAKDFRAWYRKWKARSMSRGTDGTRQAYGGIQIIRIILNFGAESGIKKCLELRTAMDKMNFRRNPPRNVVMSCAQIRAILEEAWRREPTRRWSSEGLLGHRDLHVSGQPRGRETLVLLAR